MLHTCLLVYLPPCLCVRVSISVCVGESEGSQSLTVCWHANLNFGKLCEFLLTIGILLQLFCFCSPAVAAAGRTVRKVDGDSDSDGSCCPTVLSRRPFLQSAIGCASSCRIVVVPGTAVANDWGLILWCFCAYASTLTPTLASLAQFIEKVTLQSAKKNSGQRQGGNVAAHFAKVLSGKLARVSCDFFPFLCVRRYYRRETYVNMSFDTFVSWL